MMKEDGVTGNMLGRRPFGGMIDMMPYGIQQQQQQVAVKLEGVICAADNIAALNTLQI